MTPHVEAAPSVASSPRWVRRTVAVVLGAGLVSLSAQAAIWMPGSPVPMTLQVPAVLIVGGLFGPAIGATSLALYLVLGATGLPVFAVGGVPGVARLLGPTGGYLLAYPLAAAVIGRMAGGALPRLAAGLVLGLAVIHAGGVAQLTVLTGSVDFAARFGSLPFLLGDGLKLALAGLIIWRFRSPTTRALS